MKILHIEIESCNDCPFVRHGLSTGLSHEHGYECKNKNRIIIKAELTQMIWLNKVPIPNWCSLLDMRNESEKCQCKGMRALNFTNKGTYCIDCNRYLS